MQKRVATTCELWVQRDWNPPYKWQLCISFLGGGTIAYWWGESEKEVRERIAVLVAGGGK